MKTNISSSCSPEAPVKSTVRTPGQVAFELMNPWAVGHAVFDWSRLSEATRAANEEGARTDQLMQQVPLSQLQFRPPEEFGQSDI